MSPFLLAFALFGPVPDGGVIGPLPGDAGLVENDGGIGTGGGRIDAGTSSSDGGLVRDLVEVWADLAWSGPSSRATAVWVDNRRDTSFGTSPRRGADVWVNRWRPDQGFSLPYGRVFCPSTANESFSEPRVASKAGGDTVVIWRVSAKGVPGHSIRGTTMTSTGEPLSCADVLVPADDAGTPLANLQLRESAGEFLMVWETPRSLMAKFIVSPPSDVFELAAKPDGLPWFPTLTATSSGFFAAWTQQGHHFVGVAIPRAASGTRPRAAGQYFLHLLAISHATAVGPAPTGVFINSGLSGTRHLYAGKLDSLSPTQGPQVGTAVLLAAADLRNVDPPTYAAYQLPDGSGFAVAEFGSNGVETEALSSGEPIAMVGVDGGALLMSSEGGHLIVQALLPGPQVTPGMRNTSLQNQLHHGGVWEGPDFLIGWSEGPAAFGARLSPTTGTLGEVWPGLVDAGTFTPHPAAEGPRIALTVVKDAGTSVYLGLPSSPIGQFFSRLPLLTAVGEHRSTLAGNEAAAVWTAGDDVITFGRTGDQHRQTFTGAHFGRCGAWADGALFIPLLESDGELAVLEVSDSADVVSSTTHSLGTLGVAIKPPCLAARGPKLLLVAHTPDDELVVVATTVEALRRGETPRVSSPTKPLDRAVFEPVAARNAAGWQLAWESPDEVGSQILGMKFDLQSGEFEGNMRSDGTDDRAPLLVPSADGAVALVWQHFVERTGHVALKTHVFPAEQLPQADGGVEPLVYDTCGCQSGGPALLALALLLLSVRARASKLR